MEAENGLQGTCKNDDELRLLEDIEKDVFNNPFSGPSELFMSKEALEDIRRWSMDYLDNNIRDEIYSNTY